jgi:hypothetical protein
MLPLRLAQLTITLATPDQYAEVIALVHRARIRLMQFGTITLQLPPTHMVLLIVKETVKHSLTHCCVLTLICVMQ